MLVPEIVYFGVLHLQSVVCSSVLLTTLLIVVLLCGLLPLMCGPRVPESVHCSPRTYVCSMLLDSCCVNSASDRDQLHFIYRSYHMCVIQYGSLDLNIILLGSWRSYVSSQSVLVFAF